MKRNSSAAKPLAVAPVRLDPGSLYLTPSGRICRCVGITSSPGQPDEADLVYDVAGVGAGSFTLARQNWRLLQRVTI